MTTNPTARERLFHKQKEFVMLSFVVGVGLFLSYVAIGAITYRVSYYIDKDDEAATIVGVLWPIAVPILCTVAFVVGAFELAMKVKLPSLLKFRSTEQKVLEYAKAPEKVLVELISSKILAYPEGLVWYNERWKSQDGKIAVWFWSYAYQVRGIYELMVNGKKIEGVDEKPICDALNKVRKFQEEKGKADAEAAKQLAALEAVESILLSPEKGN